MHDFLSIWDLHSIPKWLKNSHRVIEPGCDYLVTVYFINRITLSWKFAIIPEFIGYILLALFDGLFLVIFQTFQFIYLSSLTPHEDWSRLYQGWMTSTVCICERINTMISDIWRHSTLVNSNPIPFYAGFSAGVDRFNLNISNYENNNEMFPILSKFPKSQIVVKPNSIKKLSQILCLLVVSCSLNPSKLSRLMQIWNYVEACLNPTLRASLSDAIVGNSKRFFYFVPVSPVFDPKNFLILEKPIHY